MEESGLGGGWFGEFDAVAPGVANVETADAADGFIRAAGHAVFSEGCDERLLMSEWCLLRIAARQVWCAGDRLERAFRA